MSKIRPQSVAGGLRHRVTIQQKTNSLDAWGGPVETWEDYVKIWAEVIFMSGGELWAARQSNPELEGRIRIRYRDDINSLMRVKHGNKTLEILSVIPFDSKHTFLHLLFKEVKDYAD